ncbi:hypothetical protein ATE68_10090 [Sphingopyxis sp. H038]|uniref:DUF445 domain-containing protein n=1 Tax=unclassified Sphingopyxis TaxID=2614943 RepID=UPI00072FE281|nr:MULTISPECIES: DUF445 domain-containing protein [unclassified Sphingopyxis]KTE01168.1 hypothetical protein ATE78_15775 [Sphingopyxis sp. H012]KTE12519.1 hypothetical protein ATE70_04400 [Sphingopyxis sp. H053]KTE14217.1 hypothetical protein ATE76_09560 [Sphingopyxis sp. H093]KTE23366.1 hypothetical protein ATE75_19490 [Sphingopyxis sp. H080]KTE34708.1 hypothetical protein ATE68_10090 [Sphingopyxis sp. H038]
MTDRTLSRPIGVAIPARGSNIRVVATGLLIVMAFVFLGAKYFQDVHPAIGFIRAFAEAAMVGGLADWFAVTALFRHPMGLPIPHTAIIPRNKNRIGDTLARFLLNNFLLPRLIARKMQTVDVAGAVGKFLSEPGEGGGRLRLGASRIIADGLGALDQQRLGGIVKSAIADRLRELDVAPLLGQALQAALAEGRHQPLLDAMVKWGSKTLELNEHLIHQMVHDNSNAIVRFTGLDESISNRIVAGLSKLLSEMAVDETHPLRIRVEEGLAKIALDLQHDPEVKAKVAKVRDELLENKAVKRWLDGLWEQGRTALLKAARNPDTMLAGRIGELVTQFGAMLGEDAGIKRTLNRYARRAVVGVVDSYGETALRLVSDTIRGWDAKTITDRLENAVGDDLQYIRINGTLVGGLVGVLIHTVDVLI